MSALGTAVKRRKIAVNPGEHVELPSGRADRALVWTEHRVEAWQRTGQRPAASMVWTPEHAAPSSTPPPEMTCMPCGTSSRSAGCAARRLSGCRHPTSTSTGAR
jgi:hypothetical protein